MKTKIYSAALLAVLGLSLNSCKRHGNDNDQHISVKDGIIGCTQNASQKVVAAIDPVKGPEFAYSPVVNDGIAVGPAAISTDNLLYYTIGVNNTGISYQLHEINTLNGKVIRTFNLNSPYFFLVYDGAGNRLLGLSGNNELMEVDLGTGQESLLGAVVINEGVMPGTEFMRNGKFCLMGQNVLIAIDPSTRAVSRINGFDLQLNSTGYDAAKDKLFYIGTPAGSQGISLFEYDFASGQLSQLKNYPDLNSFVMHSTAYNEYTGQYHFYSASDRRTSIDVNTLNYKVEKVDYHLVNTEVIRGHFKIPNKEIKD